MYTYICGLIDEDILVSFTHVLDEKNNEELTLTIWQERSGETQ